MPINRLIVLAILAGSTLGAQATQQPSPAAVPAFDVASVKPNSSGSPNSSLDDRPGSLGVTNMPLRRLIAFAYRMHPVLDRDRIVGPDWVDTARFDIAARMSPEIPVAQIPDLLRTLLVERFKLAARQESREGPIYALLTARSGGALGDQIRSTTLDCSQRSNFITIDVTRTASIGGVETVKECGIIGNVDANGGVIRGGGRSMAELSKHLTGRVNRTVVDRTGLTGSYDFVLRFTPEGMTPRTDGAAGPSLDGTSLFTALQEQLGLKLEPQRGPVEFIVIDRIERPSPN